MILRVAPEIFQVTTLKKIRIFRTRIFSGWQPEFFLIYGINPAFFQGEGPKKSRFAKPDFFLGFETNPDFSNHKSGCRLKGRLSVGGAD